MYKRLGIKIKNTSPHKHGSLKPERHTRAISEMIAR